MKGQTIRKGGAQSHGTLKARSAGLPKNPKRIWYPAFCLTGGFGRGETVDPSFVLLLGFVCDVDGAAAPPVRELYPPEARRRRKDRAPKTASKTASRPAKAPAQRIAS